MEKIRFNYSPDLDLTRQAVAKAKRLNIAKNRTELFNFLLRKVVDGEFKPDLSHDSYKWTEGKSTTIRIDSKNRDRYSEELKLRGVRSDNTFIFNLLIYNFINNF